MDLTRTVDGVRLQRAQWKEGFLPNNIEKLENAQGKQVTLINVDIQKKPVGIARYNYLIERAEFDD